MLVVVLSQLAPHTRSQDRAVSSCPSTTEGLSLGNGEWQTHSKLCCSWVSRNLKPSSVLMGFHSLPSFPHQVFPFILSNGSVCAAGGAGCRAVRRGCVRHTTPSLTGSCSLVPHRRTPEVITFLRAEAKLWHPARHRERHHHLPPFVLPSLGALQNPIKPLEREKKKVSPLLQT